MAYLGNSPVLSQQEYRNIDNISGSFNGVTTSFALLVNGVAPVPAPQSSNQCLISVNGVVQKPDDTGATGFRISGGNIIFSSAPTGGQSFFGVILAGADYIYAGQNFPDGTVSAPSITFNQDLDTGFYRSGAGEVKFTANGANAVTLSSNNLTAPSFIPTSSSAPTNGIYLPAANSVAISTGGSGRLFVNSAGNVGIGTSPSEKFHVSTSSGFAGQFQNSNDNAGLFIYNTGFSHARIAFAGSTNTTSATVGSQGNDLAFGTNGSERLRITSAGLVGVGTSSPSGILHAYTTGNTNVFAETNNTGSVAAFACKNAAGESHVIGAETSLGNGGFGGSSAYSFCMYAGGTTRSLHLGTNGAARLTINSSGNVGIGTTSPQAVFHSKAGATTSAGIFESTSASGSFLSFVDTGTSSYTRVQVGSVGNELVLRTTDLERARIDSSGRLLVGTSSSSNLYAIGGANFAPKVQIQGTDPIELGVQRTDGPPYVHIANGQSGLASGNDVGFISFNGKDSNNLLVQAAQISAAVDGTPGANDMPGRLVFSTTADGASSPTERLRIANNGAWGLAGANYGSSSQVLTSNGSGSAPTWQTVAAPAALSTASGSAPSYSARAWVNFNGTGTVAIRASGNVSSITDNGIGDYTVNFTTAMADANYSVVGLHQYDQSNTSSGSGIFLNIARYAAALSSGSVRVFGSVGNGATLYDGTTITISVYR